MIWVIGIIVVVLILSALSNSSEKAEEIAKNAELNELSSLKAKAYGEYLRRESNDESITKLGDAELEDLLVTNIREYRSNIDSMYSWIAAFLFGLPFIGGMWSFIVHNWGPLTLLGSLGVMAAFFVYRVSNSRIKRKFTSRGLDTKRLKVE